MNKIVNTLAIVLYSSALGASSPSFQDAQNAVAALVSTGGVVNITRFIALTPITNTTTAATYSYEGSTNSITETNITTYSTAPVVNYYNTGGEENITNLSDNPIFAQITSSNIAPMIQAKTWTITTTRGAALTWTKSFAETSYALTYSIQKLTNSYAMLQHPVFERRPKNTNYYFSDFINTYGQINGGLQYPYCKVHGIGIINTP